jgi:hypothetical protein
MEARNLFMASARKATQGRDGDLEAATLPQHGDIIDRCGERHAHHRGRNRTRALDGISDSRTLSSTVVAGAW